MITKPIRLGTRRSKLALWQAYHIKDLLEQNGLPVEIIEIDTKGDIVLDKAFSKIGSKGLFTEELEVMLRSNELDIVQHSAKDVQATLPTDLELIAYTKREIANDVLISFDKNLVLDQNSSFVIGTSSTRRVAMLKHFFPNIKTVEMRGNLQTRMEKLKNGQANAILLAYAGAHRMGFNENMIQLMDMATFVPAVGQGSIAIQCATNLNSNLKNLIKTACNDSTTELCITAERAFLQQLEGGCSIPVFGHATLQNGHLELTGGIISLNGKKIIKEKLIGSNPTEIGKNLAKNLLSLGADTILTEIKSQL